MIQIKNNIKKFTLGICDDEDFFINEIVGHAEKYFKINQIDYDIYSYRSGYGLLADCDENPDLLIDLLFLDIELPDIDGIAVKDKLCSVKNVRCIVFESSHGEFMPQAFGMKVLYFLTKPFSYENISKWISVTEKEIGCDNLVVQEEEHNTDIPLSDIIRIESDREYVHIFLRNKKSVMVRSSMNDMERILKKHNIIRVHKQHCINLMFVCNIRSGIILMDDGTKISIGRAYRQSVMESYNRFNIDTVSGRLL